MAESEKRPNQEKSDVAELVLDSISAAYSDPDLVVLEGVHPAKHAIRFDAKMTLLATDNPSGLERVLEEVAPDVAEEIMEQVVILKPGSLGNLGPRKLSSPLISIAKRPEFDLPNLLQLSGSPVILLEEPRNPGNVGAVVRVSAAADVSGVIVTGRSDPWSPLAIRGGAGLQFALQVGVAQLPLVTDRPLVAIDPHGKPINELDLDPSSILMFGSERPGLSRFAKSIATSHVSLPMRDRVSSLNLATAVAATLYIWKLSGTERGIHPW